MDTDIQLDYPYSINTSNTTIASFMDLSATTAGLYLILPDSTNTNTGLVINFNNVGVNPIDIVLNDGVTLLFTIDVGAITSIYLCDNTTSNGSWRIAPFGNGVSAISNFTLQSTANSIDVTNGNITPPGGVIDIELPTFLSSINSLTDLIPGVVVVNATAPTPWYVTYIVGDSNITVTNSDGSNFGEPIVIALDSSVNITQLTVGNIVISGDLKTNTDPDEVLSITSNGSNSVVNINGVTIDTSRNISGLNNLVVEGALSSPFISKAWCRFSNTSGVIAEISYCNVSSVTYDAITFQYTINFTAPMGNIDYGVTITCSNNNSTPPLQTRIGYDIIRQLDSVVIVLSDASGEMLADIPEGVTVTIFSLT